jgi:hypothetical protein
MKAAIPAAIRIKSNSLPEHQVSLDLCGLPYLPGDGRERSRLGTAFFAHKNKKAKILSREMAISTPGECTG